MVPGKGHESIVNSALIHPHHPYILTAGIERYIRLHSPTASSMFPLSDGTATNVTDMSALCFQLAALEREVARLREHQEVQLHTALIEPPPEYYQE